MLMREPGATGFSTPKTTSPSHLVEQPLAALSCCHHMPTREAVPIDDEHDALTPVAPVREPRGLDPEKITSRPAPIADDSDKPLDPQQLPRFPDRPSSPLAELFRRYGWPDDSQRTGRPLRLTQTVAEKILLALRAGAHRSTSAKWAGIDPGSLSFWIKRGSETDDEPYHTFVAMVHEMEAHAELRATNLLTSSQDFRAAVAFLERRHPQRWGRVPLKSADFPFGATNEQTTDLAVILGRIRHGEAQSARLADQVPPSYYARARPALPEAEPEPESRETPRDPRKPRRESA